jgi:hypothetical protein
VSCRFSSIEECNSSKTKKAATLHIGACAQSFTIYIETYCSNKGFFQRVNIFDHMEKIANTFCKNTVQSRKGYNTNAVSLLKLFI